MIINNDKKNMIIIILCTLPHNMSIASKIIKTLLHQKLAACISILHGIHSFYYWENNLKNHTEMQLLIKTKVSLKRKVFDTIKKIHPYNTPELLALPILYGDKNYLLWIQSVLK